MSRLGPIQPLHREGHCGFDPTGQALCGAPASLHMLVTEDGDPWTVYACPAHEVAARAFCHVADVHPVEAPCLARPNRWQVSTAERVGFCFDEGDDALLAELHESEQVPA